MSRMHIKKGDKVVILSGNDKGKHGKVIEAMPKADKIIVEGVNIQTNFNKPNQKDQVGGITKKEGAILACKVMHVCNKCNKPTRYGRQRLETGKLVRKCKKCGETFND